MAEFHAWKEKEEEAYVKKQQTYHPQSEGNVYKYGHVLYIQPHDINTILCIIATAIKERFFYICRKYENTKPRSTSKKRFNQKDSRKTNNTCLSRMYVDNFCDGHVEVEYIPAHTGHTLYHKSELQKPLPLPASSKEEVAIKLSLGVNPTQLLCSMHYVSITCSGIFLNKLSE